MTVREGTTLQLALQLKGDDGTTLSLMLKQVPAAGRPLSVQLALAREALFYRNFRDRLPLDILPHVYYAYGDAATGAKVIIMEDLSAVAVDSGVLFGPGNPNNWHRDDLTTQAVRAGNVPAHVVALEPFVASPASMRVGRTPPCWRRTTSGCAVNSGSKDAARPRGKPPKPWCTKFGNAVTERASNGIHS